MKHLRICNVSFLNSKPYAEAKELPFVAYDECDPAECARRLHEDEADLALIPLAEALLHGDYEFLDYGIVSRGEVKSVYLFSNEPIEKLDKIYVDEKSHSSVRLLKLLGKVEKLPFYRINVEEKINSLEENSGILVIGDLALQNENKFNHKEDLANLWLEKTGLPFVFAVWAYRKGSLNNQRREELYKSFESGISKREELAKTWASQHGAEIEATVDYLKNHISYVLDEDARTGIEKFAELGEKANLIPTRAIRDLDKILLAAAKGKRISIKEALLLAERASLADLALASDYRRETLHKDGGVSYIIDRNINYTNVCNVYCRFCAFYKAPGKGGYTLSKEQIGQKLQETIDAGGIQTLFQGGLNPELGIEYYEDLFSWIKENYKIHLHALSSDEVLHISQVSKISIEETLSRLIAAGMGSLPGAGAELLMDRVRHRIARLKCKAETWLDVHRVAHRLGITSTCTMLFGVQETWEDRVLHMHKLRNLQDETGGFTAFITWPFQEENTKLKPGDTTSLEYLRVQAISRLFLDNIPNIQSSWVTMGQSIGQIALYYGANDFGSVMFEENVVSSAGTTYCMNEKLIIDHVEDAGFKAWRRDVHYNRV